MTQAVLDARSGDRLRASYSPALKGSIIVPGDKSMSHRALILGALAEGETRVTGLLEGQDVLHTAAAVTALGARAAARSGRMAHRRRPVALA